MQTAKIRLSGDKDLVKKLQWLIVSWINTLSLPNVEVEEVESLIEVVVNENAKTKKTIKTFSRRLR